MPEREPPPREEPLPSSAPPWQVILEDIRSQNRATIEAVEAIHSSLDRKIEEHRAETRAQVQVLEVAVRQNSADIHGLVDKVERSSADIRVLHGDVRPLIDKVDTTLSDVEARVSALERRRG